MTSMLFGFLKEIFNPGSFLHAHIAFLDFFYPEFVCFVPYCDGCDVGNVDISIFFDGETFSVTCMEGLEMAGDPIITCSRDLGGWDHIPECSKSYSFYFYLFLFEHPFLIFKCIFINILIFLTGEPTSPVPTTTTPATTPGKVLLYL